MLLFEDPADCCGCTACASICPHDAINMIADSLGFLYPQINPEKCVECGLCKKICSFNDSYDISYNLLEPEAYAARHIDIGEVLTSRSGAVFIAISDYIIDNGGVVYGAGYVDHFRVVHKRAETKKERNEFKGSKYVQSDLTNVFRQVKDDLASDKLVLFSGTPCQTSALRSFIGKRLNHKLFLLDIVCHGVPGPYIWRDYLLYLEKKYGKHITYVNFRDKELYGWRDHRESFKFGNIDLTNQNAYTFLFQKNINLRHSCGQCKYTNLNRPSDITIADFWGWEKIDSNINVDDKGVSLVLINTNKGRELFYSIKDMMHIIPADLANCMQPNLQKPTKIHPHREQFEVDYNSKGFEYVIKKYGNIGLRYNIKLFVRKILTMINKIIGK